MKYVLDIIFHEMTQKVALMKPYFYSLLERIV